VQGYNYTSGIWQLEGHVFVPKVTNGACILQVFGSGDGLHNTSLMLDVYNGSLMYYSFAVILPNILDRWFKVNVIDDMEDGSLRVFIDGVVLFQVPGHGGVSHYFKLGVYGQNNESYYMESRWKGIRVLYKNASNVRSDHIN
ncbi:Citrate-binding protein, partial [Linum perenne]